MAFIQKKVIILLGKPLSGKSTQAELLAKKLDFFLLVTSKLILEKFRVLPETPALKKAKAAYNSGELVDPLLVRSWVFEEIRKRKQLSKGVVLDGYPRTLQGAKALLEFLNDIYSKKDIAVFFIQVSDKEILRRAESRRIYRNGTLIRRSIDKKDILKKRLQVFQTLTQPIADYFRTQRLLIKIDGQRPVMKILEDILDNICDS